MSQSITFDTSTADDRWSESGTGTETRTPKLPTGLESLAEEMYELLRLPVDWDSYGAGPVTVTAVSAALDLLAQYQWEGPTPTIAPTSRGGVILEWGGDDTGVELEFDRAGRINVVVDDGAPEPWEFSGLDRLDPRIEYALNMAVKLA